MEPFDNNKFEIIPTAKTKRKITAPCPNAYLNPALDLLANEDPICNNAMEIVPVKKRKQIKTQDIATFENTALDLGISRAAVSEFLARELENVRKNVHLPDVCAKTVAQVNVVQQKAEDTSFGLRRFFQETSETQEGETEPIYMNVNDPILQKDIVAMNSVGIEECSQNCNETSDESIKINELDISNINEDSTNIVEEKALVAGNRAPVFDTGDISSINQTTTNVTNNVFINNQTNLSLSFINRLALDSPNASNQSLYLDDDLNESNIMETKTITIITTKTRRNDNKNSTNPFLNQNSGDITHNVDVTKENPFFSLNDANTEMEYTGTHQTDTQVIGSGEVNIMPRRLFAAASTNSTLSTMNESLTSNGYENIDSYRSESPIYENVCEDSDTTDTNYNKQSKILGHDVTKFSAVDIMNINKNSHANSSVDSTDSGKNFKHLLKVSNKLSKKVFKTLRKTFKGEKPEQNVTLNPYEVPRKLPKRPVAVKETGIENPCLNLDNSDEIEIEEEESEEHQYETIKTRRNTQLNMNVTPLKERNVETDCYQNKTHTPGKKVRFDSTLNQEKVITGNSFDYGLQSPGFDSKIEKYHDELENCINERKFIEQNTVE